MINLILCSRKRWWLLSWAARNVDINSAGLRA
jgi:hypothetical protein